MIFDIQTMDQWTNGPMVKWSNGPMVQWTNGFFNHPLGPLVHWFIGPLVRGWAKPETKNWYRFKNFLICVRLPLFEYCSIGPSLLSFSVSKSVLHDQWELLSLSEYPTLSEIYIQEIGRHYRLDRIFFLVPNLLSLVIEINEQEFKIDIQNSDNSAGFFK